MNDLTNSAGSGSRQGDSDAQQAELDRQRLLRAAMRMGLERPSSTTFSVDQPLDAPARVAALLVALGPEISGQLLQRFTAPEAQAASSMLASVRSIPRDVLIDVLQRFKEITENKTEVPFDAGKFVSAAFGDIQDSDDDEDQLEGVRQGIREKVPFYDVLRMMAPEVLQKYLSEEHPQLAATVLAILPTETSSKILGMFDKSTRIELVRRVGTLSPIEGTMLSHLNTWVSDVVHKHVVEGQGVEKTSIGGVDPAVELIDSLADKVEALDELRRRDPSLAAQVEARMFFFEDFVALDNKTLSTILASVPNDVLAVALKGASDSIQDRFLSCMTERAANRTRFDMDRNAAPRVADIEEKQREMIRIAREMERDGKVVLDRGAKSPRPV